MSTELELAELKSRLDAFTYRGQSIPERMKPGILRYIAQHIKPGDFLCAVIKNDLCHAVCRADDENIALLQVYIAYFHNEAPGACWGSPERMEAWLSARP